MPADRAMGSIAAGGDRAVAVGSAGQVFAITGDNSRITVEVSERSHAAAIDAAQVYRRVALEHFTGREWLVRKVDEFLEGADRGYLVIEAEAGLGKSTFLAWLARERGYVHHFCELTPGASGVGPALANLATQVASQCGLDEFEAEAMTSGATARPDAFYSLLERAATRRGGPLVLVVDALDEAGTPPRQNVLGLPHILPRGVFFVASQRPVPVSLWTDLATTPHIPLEIAAQSDDNLRDMREYLRKVADWAGVATERRKAGVGADEFIGALAQKCQGVWIYLHYVVHEIDGGKRSPLDLKNLPDGMTDYYVRHWRAWHDDDPPRWYATDLPLLATLAAGREALPLGRLLAWSGAAADPERVRSLLEESWRPFLLVSNEGSGVRATVYHATLREFLDGRASRARLTKAEAAFLNRMAQETVRAHGRIADHLLGAFGGLDEGLPRLKDEGGRGEEARYGLRHLAEQLEAAGRADDLHRLLRVGWPAAASQGHPENAWFAARDRLGDALGFLTDVTRAWQLAEDQFEESRDPALLGLQARYALLTTSHRTRVGLTDPRWLLKYVEAGFWPLEKALAHARQIPNPSRRAKALRLLAASPGAERGAVLDEALAAAANVVGPRKRLNTLISLIPFLASPARRRAERMALSATLSLYDEENENQFFNAMLRLLGLLHGPNLSLALQAIQGTDEYQYGSKDFVRRAMVSTPGASTSAALRRIAQAIEVFEAFLRAIGDPPYYHVGFLVVCLAAQAPRMPRPRFRRLARVLVRRQLLWRAVKRYLRMSDGYPGKSGASIALILCLRERIFGGERMFRDHFLAVLRWMHQGPAVWQAVRRAAPLLPGAMLPELIELIITYHLMFIDVNFPDTIVSQSKLSMLEVLAPHLPQDLLVGGAVPIAESLSLGYREIALNTLNVHMLMPQC